MKSVLEYLEISALNSPDKIAVISNTSSFTYKELLFTSKRIGSSLKDKSKIGKPIAVLADKNALTLATFLGIVYSGAFYVLLNPDLPLNRLKQIQSVLNAEYLITTPENESLGRELVPTNRILQMEELAKTPINEDFLSNVKEKVVDTNPLYANFTSGSTGVPKGVLVGHRSVIDFIDVFTETFGIDETDVIGNQAPFDFDVSVKDIYSAMKTGAALVVIPKKLFSSPAALLDFICEKNITTMIWAVSALCLITSLHGLDYKTPKSVKRILFSGEEMPLKHLNQWMLHLPDTEFVNLYGPTEITCNCTYHRIERDRDYSSGIPIGKAFPNENVFILNNENQLISSPSEVGEICVSGTALALGYYNNSEQTNKAFCQNPLHPEYYDRMYCTGDLGAYLESGELIFKGRKDFQIKYMGHRIELEEIERAISALPSIERCIALFDHNKQRLYGFYKGTLSKAELTTKLKEILPIYMIPKSLVSVDDFPVTKNGKVDRKALMEMR